MRYACDNKAYSFVNRAFSVAHDQSIAEYGGVYSTHRPFVSLFWTIADESMDWGGEEDGIDDTYPMLKAAYELTMMFPSEKTKDHAMSDWEKVAENIYRDAVEVAVELENYIYLAICVVNTIEASAGSALNVWQSKVLMDRIYKEFEKERNSAKIKIKNILHQDPFYHVITKTQAATPAS